jgi:hypothetical protein
MKFKFILVGDNKNGTRIFCKLQCNNRNVLRGFYDFDIEKFIITKYIYDNFPQNVTKNKVKKELKKILLLNYDWTL